ncbi:GNAT family N-acetyltransferase [Streptomyces qinglanensis]|uniref:GNAT family N-acetyltransferase n=1 Tax=Streptomyces qinglanensis TaxID=943816 RepID=UPI0037AA7283
MDMTSYILQGPRVAIRHLRCGDYAELTALRRESAEMLTRWLGAREHSEEAFRGELARLAQPINEGFVICLRSSGEIAGGVNINNIVRGTLQSGTLGYTAYASTTGHGYMTEGLRLVLRHAFANLKLHRLEANIQPNNVASLNLARRIGLRREGYSEAFQFINGAWRDHERWAITADTLVI